MNEAPDYCEPFEGWRVWKVVRREGRYTLGSVIQRTLWPAGRPLDAECLRSRLRLTSLFGRSRHDAPDAGCVCGVYAGRLDCIGTYVAEAPCRGLARVLGRVALWGTVIECDRGFRASRAYPTRIYVPADVGEPWRVSWEEVALGLARYRAPIEMLAARASEATQLLAERQAA